MDNQSVYHLQKNDHTNSIRCEFIRGMNRGKIQWIRWDLAEALLRTGVAIERDRGLGVAGVVSAE